MHNSANNPATNPALAGKHLRHATGTRATRHFSSDKTTEDLIQALKEWLKGEEENDIVTVSLLTRRAFAVYFDFCKKLDATSGGAGVELERNVVRRNSQRPSKLYTEGFKVR